MFGVKSKEEFTLEEGRVLIRYPNNITAESLDDLRAYLDIFYRKLCRKVGVPFEPSEVEDTKDRYVRQKLEKLESVK